MMSTLDLINAGEIIESKKYVVARARHATVIFDPIQRVAYSTSGLGEEVDAGFIPREIRNKMLNLDYTPENFVLLKFSDVNKSWRPSSVEVFNEEIRVSSNNKKYLIL